MPDNKEQSDRPETAKADAPVEAAPAPVYTAAVPALEFDLEAAVDLKMVETAAAPAPEFDLESAIDAKMNTRRSYPSAMSRYYPDTAAPCGESA